MTAMYSAPHTLQEALARIEEAGPGDVPLFVAGGQVIVPWLRQSGQTSARLLDLSRIKELQGIRECSTHVQIGACVTHTEISLARPIRQMIPALQQAADQIGDWQVRNRATVGGTVALGDASGDYWPVFYACGAQVVLHAPSGSCQIPLTEWLIGRFHTVRQPTELVTAVLIPKRQHSRFAKHVLPNGETVSLALAEQATGSTALSIGGLLELPLLVHLHGPTDEQQAQAVHWLQEKIGQQLPDTSLARYKLHLATLQCKSFFEKEPKARSQENTNG